MNQVLKQIHTEVQNARRVVIVMHENPDGDALGSAGAFWEYVNNMGKPVSIYNISPINQRLSFLPQASVVTNDQKIFAIPETLVVVLDCGDLKRAGIHAIPGNWKQNIINIDHHNRNSMFGRINFVKTESAATSLLIYHLFKINSVKINNNISTALFTGIYEDTGGFTNSATSAEAMAAAGDLLRLGANWKIITQVELKNKTVGALRLWGKALERLTRHEATTITYTYILQADLIESEADDSETEGIANFLNNLENSGVALMLKETEDGRIKGSFRTTHDHIDVSEMARKLGGGGHKKAAGFMFEGKMDEAIDRILTL